jgi:hypothetical protein
MEETFKGLRAERSDESYALEFLKTGQENLKLSQARANLNIGLHELSYHLDWVKELAARCEALAQKVSTLETKASK